MKATDKDGICNGLTNINILFIFGLMYRLVGLKKYKLHINIGLFKPVAQYIQYTLNKLRDV